MIVLLSPVALVGLLGLAVPVVIHLQRRQECQTVDFAAMRWLRRRAVPREQWRWHERWLLALRLLLIAAAVALLARPVWHGAEIGGVPWVVVSPEVPLAAARAAINAPAAKWHWLAPGWPGVDTPGRAARGGAWASLVRDLDASLPAPTALTIVMPDRLDAAAVSPLQLRRSVAWRPVPTGDAATGASARHLVIAIRASGPAVEELAVARALIRAWHVSAPSLGWNVALADAEAPIGDATAPIGRDVAFVFWLSGSPSTALETWISAGGTALTTGRGCPARPSSGKPDDASTVSGAAWPTPVLAGDDGTPVIVAQTHGRGRLLCLATALTPQATPALRDADAPTALLGAIVAGRARPGPMPVDAGSLAPTLLPSPAHPLPGRPLDSAVATAIAALFLAERWWATRPARLAA